MTARYAQYRRSRFQRCPVHPMYRQWQSEKEFADAFRKAVSPALTWHHLHTDMPFFDILTTNHGQEITCDRS